MRRIAAAALAALVLPATASAAVELRNVDVSGYPTVRATVVASSPSSAAPKLRENGSLVPGLSAQNLGESKSVVLAIDRSKSMAGRSLADAIRAARRFVAAKPQLDRISIVVFGSRAFGLTTGFSSATIDADIALRSLSVDRRQGTALYDAVALAARNLATEPDQGRVIILLTDGRDVSKRTTLEQAVATARSAGAAVYPIAIEGPQFSPRPLKQLAAKTGGTYYAASSTHVLAKVYSAIAKELRHTWLLEYATSARPGDRLTLSLVGGAKPVSVQMPGSTPAGEQRGSRLLPAQVYNSALGTLLLAIAVGVLALAAVALLGSAERGSRLRRRLDAHVGSRKPGTKTKTEGQRLAAAAGLFRATEHAFGSWRRWQILSALLARADVPLKTVEFVYLATGCSFAAGLFCAVLGSPTFLTVVALVGGWLAPVGVVWLKAQRRTRAFEEQLPDLLITLAASLKAGHSFKQGLQTLVDEGREPASKEFKRVLTETQLGRPIDDALAEATERVGSKDFTYAMTAVTIQRQVGGSLAGLFDLIADTVRQRQQFARKIRGLTAMGRMSAYVLTGIPFALAGMQTLINPGYMSPLWTTSQGHMLLGIMLVMMVIGSLILKKIVSFRG